jgi:hypothetical protein
MRHNYEIWQGSMTPKDADFLGGLAWSLEDVARAYKVPLDLIGGQRTYANVEAALKALWMHCLLPEAEFIASELTERLLPMFPAQAGDVVEFDISGVPALQEAEDSKWTRRMQQLEKGALTINEWREEAGQTPVPWGDVWWAPAGLRPVDGVPEPLEPNDPATEPRVSPGEAAVQEEDAAELEQRYAGVLADVGRRQRQSTQAGGGGDARWLKAYRVALRAAGASERDAQRLAKVVIGGSYVEAVHS